MKIERFLIVSMLLLAVLLMTCPRASRAQVYEWVDEQSGAHHYTNSLQNVPEAVRSKARLFVKEAPMSKLEDEVPMSKVEEPDEIGPTAEDEDVLAAAYREGVEAGYRAARAEQPPAAPAEPPVVVLDTPPPVVVTIPRYDPSGLYYLPPSEGRMSVPFDGGRTRGLTHRQHLQEQRRIERDW